MKPVVLKPVSHSSHTTGAPRRRVEYREPPRRKKSSGKWWKGVLVVLGAMGLTTLAIHASDSFSIPGSSLLAGVGGSTRVEHCPSDMVYIPDSGGGYCIDRFENSAGDLCANKTPSNQFQTEENLQSALCLPVSAKSASPWANISQTDAIRLCAKAGKRLPSNREWYRAALNTPDALSGGEGKCALGQTGKSNADLTGAHAECVSSYGAYDMVGNVWEWVDASVRDGLYENHPIPDEGFVSEADLDGVPTQTRASSSPAFGDDYFFADKVGMRGMFRGGFWSMNEKAGVYSINATIPTSFIGVAVGFRCAKDAE